MVDFYDILIYIGIALAILIGIIIIVTLIVLIIHHFSPPPPPPPPPPTNRLQNGQRVQFRHSGTNSFIGVCTQQNVLVRVLSTGFNQMDPNTHFQVFFDSTGSVFCLQSLTTNLLLQTARNFTNLYFSDFSDPSAVNTNPQVQFAVTYLLDGSLGIYNPHTNPPNNYISNTFSGACNGNQLNLVGPFNYQAFFKFNTVS